MPREKTMPCAICKQPMWKSPTSRPEGEAAHNACRKERRQTRGCVDCGVALTTTNRDPRCSPCRHTRAKARATKQCHCGNPVIARGMCGTHYSTWHREKNGRTQKTYTRTCLFCGDTFQTVTPKTLCCTSTCGIRLLNGWSTSKEVTVYVRPAKPAPTTTHVRTTNRLVCGSCCICGEDFVSFYRDITCSPDCQTIHRRRQRAMFKDKRRALKRNAFVAPVYRLKVFKADGYRCHLCGKLARRDAVVPHPMAPTIDHIIPLAKGGTHEPINCRTAHFICNSRKGDRGTGDQLLLFAA